MALYRGDVHHTLTKQWLVCQEVLLCFLYKHNVHLRLVVAGWCPFTAAEVTVVKQSEECCWNVAPIIAGKSNLIRRRAWLIY